MADATKIRVKDAVDRFVARVRHNMDVHLDILVSDLTRAAEELGIGRTTLYRKIEEYGLSEYGK